VAINCNHLWGRWKRWAPVVIRGNQWPSIAITCGEGGSGGPRWSSEAISGHQLQSPVGKVEAVGPGGEIDGQQLCGVVPMLVTIKIPQPCA